MAAENRDFLAELVSEIKEIRNEIKVIDEKNERKFEELKNEIAKISGKMIPIRKAVIGEWKMVEYQNWEATKTKQTFEELSENLKFEMVDRRLTISGAGNSEVIEGEDELGRKYLWERDNQLNMTSDDSDDSLREEIYIENGRLHYVVNVDGHTWTRFYEKI